MKRCILDPFIDKATMCLGFILKLEPFTFLSFETVDPVSSNVLIARAIFYLASLGTHCFRDGNYVSNCFLARVWQKI